MHVSMGSEMTFYPFFSTKFWQLRQFFADFRENSPAVGVHDDVSILLTASILLLASLLLWVSLSSVNVTVVPLLLSA
jgi:hypothetical protein